MKEYIARNPPYKYVEIMIEEILGSMVASFSNRLIRVVEVVFRLYNSEIVKLRSTVPLVKLIV